MITVELIEAFLIVNAQSTVRIIGAKYKSPDHKKSLIYCSYHTSGDDWGEMKAKKLGRQK